MTRTEYIDQCRATVAGLFAKKRLLISYVRAKNSIRATVAAVKCDNGEIVLGFSKRNRRDKHNKYIGINKAVERALEDGTPPVGSDDKLLGWEYADLAERSETYFKATVAKHSLP